jgi:hypothetical protein
MYKEFISYEQALELLKLGFTEECFLDYSVEKQLTNKWSLGLIPAPLYQQAFRWFREKHNLDHFVKHHIDGTNQTYFSMARKSTWDVTNHETYEEAELACLNKLIKIVKTN